MLGVAQGLNGRFEWDMTPDSEGVTIECNRQDSTTRASASSECRLSADGGMHVGASYAAPLSRSGRSRWKVGCKATLKGAGAVHVFSLPFSLSLCMCMYVCIRLSLTND